MFTLCFTEFLLLQEPVPCRLAVKENDVEEVVAEGTAWPWKEGTLVHHKPLSRHNVRVSVDKILAGKSSHPVPWDANVRVADVFGSFEQWPKMLVYLENSEVNKYLNHIAMCTANNQVYDSELMQWTVAGTKFYD